MKKIGFLELECLDARRWWALTTLCDRLRTDLSMFFIQEARTKTVESLNTVVSLCSENQSLLIENLICLAHRVIVLFDNDSSQGVSLERWSNL